MTYYQACCLLVFAILGTAILIDPVTQFVIANPLFVARRLIFAWWYMFWTTPRLVFWFTIKYPETSIEFYNNLLKQYILIFGEDIARMKENGEWDDFDDE